MYGFPRGDFAAGAVRYYPLLPVDISQIPGENLLAVLHQLLPKDLGYHRTVGGT